VENTNEKQTQNKSRLVIEYLWKTFPFRYYKFSGKRKVFFSTLKLMHLLEHKKEESDIDLPFYLIRFLSSSELSLKSQTISASKESSEKYAKICDLLEYQSQRQLKLLNYDEFDDILVDFDRYVKNIKKRSFSAVYSYMKANRLSSLVHTKPAEETVFRFMDIRLRVYLYQLMNRYVDDVRSTESFFKYIKDSGLEIETRNLKNSKQTMTLESQSTRMQSENSFRQRLLQLSIADVLLKNQWSDQSLVNDLQLRNLTSWTEHFKLSRSHYSKSKRYNTALYNRLLNLNEIYGDYAMENNQVLLEMARHAYFDVNQGSYSGLFSLTASFDSYLKELLFRKCELLTNEWPKKHLLSISDESELNRASNKMLLSMKLAMKYCQMILIIQNYVDVQCQVKREVSLSNSSQEQTEAQLLNRLHLLPLSTIEKSNSNDGASSKKFFKYFMTKILTNHILRSEKFKELETVLQKFKESTKKDQDMVVKNEEYDHIICQNMNFCKMAGLLASQKKFGKVIPSSPELIVENELIQNYLNSSVNSSFLSSNRHLLETNLMYICAELVKCILNDQTDVFNKTAEFIALKKPSKKKLKVKRPKLKDNLYENIMAKNGSRIS
jgi:hypothetical protein